MAGCIAGCQYIPSVEFFAHWHHHGHMLIEAHEHFQKRTWRNYTAIQASEIPLSLTVPLKRGKHHQKPITEVEISYDEAWHRIHLNSIRTTYGKTSFLNEMEADIKELLYSNQEKLWDLNIAFIHCLTALIGGRWDFELTTNFIPEYPAQMLDLRKGVPAGVSMLSQEKTPAYEQIHRLGKTHIPNLSILDALCHLGPRSEEHTSELQSRLHL